MGTEVSSPRTMKRSAQVNIGGGIHPLDDSSSPLSLRVGGTRMRDVM
jgi:hypothetical protein